ncbi:DNA-processing protein DprA [Candidatus Stoquefichus massiliensis]|uniref:DNA-processing protein DprA n=1 Tax=Candidatus Stoquefichus massiliensis TaxID=1470350 RepID=UPI000488173A|nr:DNA-processing protein DprA [Candidatus Stoquefichus massiliensis]
MEELVLYFSLKYEGNFQSIYNALLRKETVDENLRCELKKKLKCSYTTIFSDDYPEALKLINCPPFVLYYYGDLSLVKKKLIGIVGMRDMSDYGKKATQHFTSELVKSDYVIVSGMARGVDTVAHKSAIENKGKTIAVLGTGIEYCYPRENKVLYEELKAHHLVLSEYPDMTAPQKKLFPFRNRIIAGLSQKIMISEARVKSGTMITAGYALEQGKDIYCVPGRFDDFDGCNELIKQGAKLITNVQDIIEDEDFG